MVDIQWMFQYTMCLKHHHRMFFLMSEEIFDTVSESPPSWVRVREREIERGAKELTTAAP